MPAVTRIVKFIRKGEKGDKGDVGPSLRGPQNWDDVAVGYQFYAGGQNDPYKDVVIWNGNYYSCTKNHTKTASNNPTSDADNNSNPHLWTTTDKVEIVATQILLAAFAIIRNLGVEHVQIGGTSAYTPDNNGEIVMLDASNNVLFQVKNGNVICKTGTFQNINVQSGKIAGFEVSGNGLSNSPFTNDAYIIFRNDTYKAFAGIGGNVLPSSSGIRAVARFENEDQTDQWGIGANYAMILSAKNGGRNYAFAGTGNGVLNGWIGGFAFHKYTIAAANTYYEGDSVLNMNKANQFIVHCDYSNSGVCLPKLSAVRSALGIGSSTDFCVKITIISDLGNTKSWEVVGRNNKKTSNNTYPWNTDQLPLLTHWDGSNWDTCAMGAGDSLVLMLVYEASKSTMINGYTTKYTARIINRQD